jgi:hypothetical protein
MDYNAYVCGVTDCFESFKEVLVEHFAVLTKNDFPNVLLVEMFPKKRFISSLHVALSCYLKPVLKALRRALPEGTLPIQKVLEKFETHPAYLKVLSEKNALQAELETYKKNLEKYISELNNQLSATNDDGIKLRDILNKKTQEYDLMFQKWVAREDSLKVAVGKLKQQCKELQEKNDTLTQQLSSTASERRDIALWAPVHKDPELSRDELIAQMSKEKILSKRIKKEKGYLSQVIEFSADEDLEKETSNLYTEEESTISEGEQDWKQLYEDQQIELFDLMDKLAQVPNINVPEYELIIKNLENELVMAKILQRAQKQQIETLTLQNKENEDLNLTIHSLFVNLDKLKQSKKGQLVMKAAAEPDSLKISKDDNDDDSTSNQSTQIETKYEAKSLPNTLTKQEFEELKKLFKKLDKRIQLHAHLNFDKKKVNKLKKYMRGTEKIIRKKDNVYQKLQAEMINKLDGLRSTETLMLISKIEEINPQGLLSQELMDTAKKSMGVLTKKIDELYTSNETTRSNIENLSQMKQEMIKNISITQSQISAIQNGLDDMIESSFTSLFQTQIRTEINSLMEEKIETVRSQIQTKTKIELEEISNNFDIYKSAVNDKISKQNNEIKLLKQHTNEMSSENFAHRRVKKQLYKDIQLDVIKGELNNLTELNMCTQAINKIKKDYASYHIINTTKFNEEKLSYFNPVKRMPYDSRMSVEEWDCQKNINQSLRYRKQDQILII